MFGAIAYYLYNGEHIWDDPEFEGYRDVVYPKTGRIRHDGSADRVAGATYMKDLYAYARDPYKTVMHKLHPMWGTVEEILSNRDFFGVEVRNREAPLDVQLVQATEYFAKQFIPFSIRNVHKQMEMGATLGEAAPLIGFAVPAPAEISRSRTLQRITKLLARRYPRAARPREEFERSQRRNRLTGLLRESVQDDPAEARTQWGNMTDAQRQYVEMHIDPQLRHDMRASVAMGHITEPMIEAAGYTDRAQMMAELGLDGLNAVADRATWTYLQDKFAQLQTEDMVEVWRDATSEQRREVWPIFDARVSNMTDRKMIMVSQDRLEMMREARRLADEYRDQIRRRALQDTNLQR
jgi:hypothetical protein